jgi:hypothetical protein
MGSMLRWIDCKEDMLLSIIYMDCQCWRVRLNMDFVVISSRKLFRAKKLANLGFSEVNPIADILHSLGEFLLSFKIKYVEVSSQVGVVDTGF